MVCRKRNETALVIDLLHNCGTQGRFTPPKVMQLWCWVVMAACAGQWEFLDSDLCTFGSAVSVNFFNRLIGSVCGDVHECGVMCTSVR